MGLALAVAATPASADPVTLPLRYVLANGTPGYSLAGSITYDSAIQGSNVHVGSSTDLTGLLAFSLTLSGPDVPGGTTSFALSDITGWFFTTDAGGNYSAELGLGNSRGVRCVSVTEVASGASAQGEVEFTGGCDDLRPPGQAQVDLLVP